MTTGTSDTGVIPVDGRHSERAAEIGRGVCRLLALHGFACVYELSLASGRRADVAAISDSGDIWIVEIKSSIEDFRVDQKWPEYRDFCDRLLFAVAPGFPVDILPPDTGLIIADRFGGELARPAPEHRLAGARRKAVTLRLARTAALRLCAIYDPDAALELPLRE
ncbi:MAG: MmcB family DNA repair protein [Hyphomicrobiaceae bacterium]